VIEPKLVLRGLEAVLDRPAMAFDGNQCLDWRSSRAPGGEVALQLLILLISESIGKHDSEIMDVWSLYRSDG
jgi:hypothetical protein